MEKFKEEEYLRQQYWGEGKSQKEIAEQFDVYPGLIHYWMEKHGIPRRDAIEEVKRKNRVEYARFETDAKGYERWVASDFQGGQEIVFVARLLAVAKYGFDAVRDKEIHHKIPIPWLNTPGNIVPLDPGTHRSNHHTGVDRWESKETPWRDKETLQRLYVEEQLSTREVGDELGCDASTVRDWLVKHSIPTRSVAEAKRVHHSKS